MLAADREALICDFAETYGIYDIQALPITMLATLAVGLRETSRIRMKMSGTKVANLELFTAAIVDRLSMLVWFQTEDAGKGFNRPLSLVELLIGDTTENDIQPFFAKEEFEKEWSERTGVNHGY